MHQTDAFPRQQTGNGINLERSKEKDSRRLVDYVLDQLAEWGVQRIYGVVGDAVLPLISAMAERQTPRFVPTRHEEAAAFMAKAEAILTGGIGVCLATSGPGAAHLINGLADAQTDSVPVLAITGQQESVFVGTQHRQVIDQQRLLGAVCEYSAQLAHPAAIGDVLGLALRTAVGKSKVAHLCVPKDFWQAELPPMPLRPFEPFLKTPARSGGWVIDGAVGMLHQAERPLILAGIGARAAIGEVLQLAEALRAPVVHTLSASGQFPRDHHLVMGSLGEGGTEITLDLIRESDCILRLGTTWWPRRYVPEAAITIDINLKPEHVGLGSPPRYGVVGPIEEILPQMIYRAPAWPRPPWEARVAAAKAQLEEGLVREIQQARETPEATVHPALLIDALNRHIPPSSVISLDVGEHVLWFNRYFRGSGRQDILISGYWRTMGCGLPYAIASSLVQPHRPAVAIVGDGGLSMSLAEMLTAVKHRAPVVVIVLNNRSLAMEEHEMEMLGLHVDGVGLNNPDFARFASLCGARGLRIERSRELDHVLQQAFERDGPTLVDVVTSPAALPVPRPARDAKVPAFVTTH